MPPALSAIEQNVLATILQTLTSYNGLMVLTGTLLLGVSAGVVGTFMMLRKRSLVGDVVGHAAVPGIAIAFIICELIQPGTGKNVPSLIVGAFIAGLIGAMTTLAIDRTTLIKTDAALAIVLATFYGLGVALFGVVQKSPGGSAAGLKNYLNGMAASLVWDDVKLFAAVAVLLIVFTVVLFKEFTILCFDADFAAAQGWPTLFLEVLLTLFVVGVTILGMQSVGLVLVVATLVIPPTAARFWTNNMRMLVLLSGVIGGMCSLSGVAISAMGKNLATGPLIVLSGTVIFLVSLVFGKERGLWSSWSNATAIPAASAMTDEQL